MTLGSTQGLTEMGTRNLPGGKKRRARKADKLTAICEQIVQKMWEPRRLTSLLASTTCYTDRFTFFSFVKYAGYTKWNSKMIQSGELEVVTKEAVVY
jgi:hypothetical protein